METLILRTSLPHARHPEELPRKFHQLFIECCVIVVLIKTEIFSLALATHPDCTYIWLLYYLNAGTWVSLRHLWRSKLTLSLNIKISTQLSKSTCCCSWQYVAAGSQKYSVYLIQRRILCNKEKNQKWKSYDWNRVNFKTYQFTPSLGSFCPSPQAWELVAWKTEHRMIVSPSSLHLQCSWTSVKAQKPGCCQKTTRQAQKSFVCQVERDQRGVEQRK